MLFLQFVQYLSSFVDSPKNVIPGAALELCKLKIKQLSPDILKFSTKHKNNPFTLNWYMVPCTFLFIFHAGLCRMGSNNFQSSCYGKKRLVWTVFLDYFSVFYDYGLNIQWKEISPCQWTNQFFEKHSIKF